MFTWYDFIILFYGVTIVFIIIWLEPNQSQNLLKLYWLKEKFPTKPNRYDKEMRQYYREYWVIDFSTNSIRCSIQKYGDILCKTIPESSNDLPCEVYLKYYGVQQKTNLLLFILHYECIWYKPHARPLYLH